MKKFYLILSTLFSIILFAQQLEVINPKPSFREGKKIRFVNSSKGFLLNEKELFITNDSGNKWTKILDISNGSDIYFNNNIGFLYGNNGSFYKTSDFGENWQYDDFFEGKNLIKMKIIGDSVYTLAKDSIYISNLEFNQRQHLKLPDNSMSTIDFVSEKFWIMGTLTGKIYKTIDSGKNWVLKSSANYSPADYYFVSFVNENLGFANRGHGEFYKTLDGGETWTRYDNFSNELYDIFFIDSVNGYACGQSNSIYKTTNGGQTWSYVGLSADGNTDLNSLHFTNSQTGFVTGEKGRILKTTDAGNTWKEYAPFYDDISKLELIGEKSIIALIKNNTYMRSNDLGETWTKLSSPGHYAYTTDFLFPSSNVGYSLGGGTSDGYSFFKTTNGGSSWTKLGTTNNNFNGSLYFFDDNHGLLGGEKGTFETIDGGVTWTRINTTSIRNMKFFDSQNGIASSFGYYSYDKLYKTSDGGKTWVQIFNNFDNPVIDYDFVNMQFGYLSQNSGMKKTIDGGVTWQNISAPQRIDVIKFHSPSLGFIHDDFNHISYRTIDGGSSWIPMDNLNELNEVKIQNDTVYFAGVFGQIFSAKISDLSLGINSVNESNELISVYPNPSKNNFYYQSSKQVISIRIFNSTGQIVKQISQPIDNQIILNKPAGVYYIQFTTKLGTITKKIILSN